MNYAETYALLAKRAIEQGDIDARAFVESLAAAGVSEERIMELVGIDLENDGPIFGKFLRTMTGASQATVTSAGRQGQAIGELYDAAFGPGDKSASDEAIQAQIDFMAGGDGRSMLEDLMESADPYTAEELQDATNDEIMKMWVATLENTCDECLPQHGVVMTEAEWRAEGLHPSLMHQGWTSSCQCILEPYEQLGPDARKALMAPLIRVRQKLETATGLKGNKTTARAIAQFDLDKSLAARDKARDSEKGRRTMRILGQVNAKGKKDDEQ